MSLLRRSPGIMPRIRVGVALLIPEPFASEINGLRRALGDGAFDRIPPHLTLVPPVNVRVEDVPAALALLRAEASFIKPFTVTLGPVGTFHPITPVIKLDVAGHGTENVVKLRNNVFRSPLERPLTHDFVPHVTLADEADPDRITSAVEALRDYDIALTFDRLHLLEEGEHRVWAPIADAPFREPLIVGRGGLPLELSITQLVDPEARLLIPEVATRTTLVVTARRQGTVVGVMAGEYRGDDAVISSISVLNSARSQGVGAQLVRAFCSEAAANGSHLAVLALPEETDLKAFFERQGFAHGVRLL